MEEEERASHEGAQREAKSLRVFEQTGNRAAKVTDSTCICKGKEEIVICRSEYSTTWLPMK
jgi:hypothetical protein